MKDRSQFELLSLVKRGFDLSHITFHRDKGNFIFIPDVFIPGSSQARQIQGRDKWLRVHQMIAPKQIVANR